MHLYIECVVAIVSWRPKSLLAAYGHTYIYIIYIYVHEVIYGRAGLQGTIVGYDAYAFRSLLPGWIGHTARCNRSTQMAYGK